MSTSVKTSMKHAIKDYFKGDSEQVLMFGDMMWWSMIERFSLQQLEYIMSDPALLMAFIDRIWIDLQNTKFNDIRY